MRKESHVRYFTCDEPRHIEDDYKGKSFKPISKFTVTIVMVMDIM